jgi:bifunctional hydroxylase/dehydrase
MNKLDADVIIVGAGPTGLMLAAELHLAGISTLVVERLNEPMQQSRALGFSARTMEEFGQRGLLPEFGDMGIIPVGHFGGIMLDYRIVPGGSFGVRGVPQSLTEAILTRRAEKLGAVIVRGHEVTGLASDEAGAEVSVLSPEGPQVFRGRYVIGCDGGRSTIRKLAGIDFPGTDATIEMKLADVTDCEVRLRPAGELTDNGMVVVLPLGPRATRVVVFERGAAPRATTEPPTFTEVADSFQRVTGEDIHHGTPLWTSFFTDSSRQAAQYRRGPVFLAGDAAHTHLPIGAQGISAGLGDAVNLGWKLAATINGTAPSGLLDTYHDERYPVGARVVANTLVQRTLYLGGPEAQPLRDIFGELLQYDIVKRHLVSLVAGLDISYPMAPGEQHPLVGRRLANEELIVGQRKTTTHELLQSGRGLLLDLADDEAARRSAVPWRDRVDIVTATRQDGGEAISGILVRPDGYIAAAVPGGPDAEPLTSALARWFGAPTEQR